LEAFEGPELGERAYLLPCNLSEWMPLTRCPSRRRAMGSVDIFGQQTRHHPRQPVHAQCRCEMEFVINVNLTATFKLVQRRAAAA